MPESPTPQSRVDSSKAGKMPTMDGRRLELEQLNVGREGAASQASGGFLQRFRRAVALFLAGMYTGVKCGGVPHSHHSYDRDDRPL